MSKRESERQEVAKRHKQRFFTHTKQNDFDLSEMQKSFDLDKHEESFLKKQAEEDFNKQNFNFLSDKKKELTRLDIFRLKFKAVILA